MPKRLLRRPLVIAAVCVVVGAAAGIAGSAASPKHRSNSTNAQRFHVFRFRHEGDFRGGPPVHVEAVVLNKAGDGFITVTSDAGKVKSVSGDQLTITEGVGSVTYKDVTLTIPPDATVQRDFDTAKLSDLQAGDFVRVESSTEGTRVFAVDPSFKPPRGPGRGYGPGPWGGPPPPAPPQ